jgi:dTDP-glucose 4,6-dehydratase
MKVLVTGGAGFIGSNFIHYLLSLGDGYQVVNYDKLTYAGNLANLYSIAKNANYQFVCGDICDAALVHEAMQGCDAVVHFAAESHVDRSIYDPQPVIDTNVRGTFVLLKVARERRIPRFVHISTDEVYGDLAPGQTADEDFPLRPNSPYSASKASADLLVRSFVKTYGFPAIITRSSNNYGPYQFPEKFLPLIISNALEDKPLPVYGDGHQERDWVHVEDNCRAIQMVLERGKVGEIYNIGSGTPGKNLAMVRQLLKILNKPVSLIQCVADRPGHDRRYALNCSKIKEELGWQPLVSLEDGLHKTAEWYRSNAEWLAAVRGGEYRSYYARYYGRREEALRELACLGPTLGPL